MQVASAYLLHYKATGLDNIPIEVWKTEVYNKTFHGEATCTTIKER